VRGRTRVAARRYCQAVLANMPPHGQKPQMLRARRQRICKDQRNNHNHNTRNLHYTPLPPHTHRCRRSFEFLPAASTTSSSMAARHTLFLRGLLLVHGETTEKWFKSGP
jgi:hypothetical protein